MELAGKILIAFLIRLSVLGVLAIGGVASIALACSPVEDYVRHTSYDLVEQSDAIVIAEVVEGLGLGLYKSGLRFKVLETIKGDVPGNVDLPYGYLKDSHPSDPLEISAPHPDSLVGSCNRLNFSKNVKYILMLEQVEDGSWRTYGGPFTRGAEDYYGPDSYWARAIETYLDIQKTHTPMAQLEVLYLLRAKHADAEDGSFEQALANDIRTHVWSLSSRKPTAYLLHAYDAVEAALEGKKPALGGFGPSILNVLRESFEDDSLPLSQEFLERMRISILRQFYLGDHAGAASLIGRIADDDPTGEELSAGILFFGAVGQRERALNLYQEYGWDKGMTEPKWGVHALYHALLSLKPDEEAGDEAAIREWAETVFAFSEIRRLRFGESWGDLSVSGILYPDNYRDNETVTLALARNYDEQVLKWAHDEISRFIDAQAAVDEVDVLPISVLLESFGSWRAEHVEQLLCQSRVTRRGVIEAYKFLLPDNQTLDLLKYIANAPLDDEERDALILSVAAHIGWLHNKGDDSRVRLKQMQDYRTHLERLVAGQAIFCLRAIVTACALANRQDALLPSYS